ncbi:MAG: hypothetical protein WD768_06025 [Phycisphaeraceae bacterium]
MKRTRNRFGFSVPELLAVIAIVLILISLLLPTLSRSRDVARTAICASRLHNLHQAYMSRQVEVKSKTSKNMVAGLWQSYLLPHVGQDTRVMKCVYGDLGSDGGQMGAITGGNSTNNATSAVYLKVFNAYPNGYLYDMAMEPGPLCRQVDASTTDAQIDALWVGTTAAVNARPIIKGFRNQCESQPYSYLLCFEDLRPDGGDKDYEDVIFLVTEGPDGVEIKFLYDGAGYVFDLLSQDGTVIAAKLDNNGDTKPGSIIPLSGVSGVSGGESGVSGAGIASYGMNNAIEEKSKTGAGKNVVFMLDYARSVAKGGWGPKDPVTGNLSSLGFDPWNDWLTSVGVPKFARHHFKANVAFYDGSVKLMDTALFDPKITQYRTDYWLP